jgi:capsular polysaccharide biosynthesis protein
MSRFFQHRELSFTKLFLTLFVTIIAVAAIRTTLQPRTYVGRARLHVAPFNPPRMDLDYRSESEKIVSRPVLTDVIAKLGLEQKLAKGAATNPRNSELYQLLLRMVRVRHDDKTGLLDIQVFQEDPQLAAEIANAIAKDYAERSERYAAAMSGEIAKSSPSQSNAPAIRSRVRIVENARPNSRPVRPNVLLNLAVACLVGLPIAALLAVISRSTIKRVPSRASPA